MRTRGESWPGSLVALAATALVALAICALAEVASADAAGPEAAGTEASASTPKRVLVTRDFGDDKLFFRPHQFVLSGDGTFGISQVKWKSYGERVATAIGVAFVNDCEPNCAEGTFSHPNAKLWLKRVIDCNGVDVYARLRYQLFGFLPAGLHHRGSFAMRPRDETGSFEC